MSNVDLAMVIPDWWNECVKSSRRGKKNLLHLWIAPKTKGPPVFYRNLFMRSEKKQQNPG